MMAAQNLPKKGLIHESVLRKIADARLREAMHLRSGGYYSGAVYLAGYAVECLLKAAICRVLGWEQLRSTFAVHDLEGLLLHSGLQRRIEEPDNETVFRNFKRISEVWIVVGTQSIRYTDPASITQRGAREFLDQIMDPTTGVATWLRTRI